MGGILPRVNDQMHAEPPAVPNPKEQLVTWARSRYANHPCPSGPAAKGCNGKTAGSQIEHYPKEPKGGIVSSDGAEVIRQIDRCTVGCTQL